jgi:hypothetical protein
VRALRFRPDRAPDVVELEPTLGALQRVVRGHLDVIRAGDRLLVNEDGAPDPLGNVGGIRINGVAVLVRKDAERELSDVTDDDIAELLSGFRPAKMN